MRFCRNGFLPCLAAIAVIVFAFNATSYAQQFSVSVSAPSNAMTVPTGDFDVTATATNIPTTLSKIVFYKNDVPYKTVTGSSPIKIITENLGQDTYTYRARAYDSNGTWVESTDFGLTVKVPGSQIFRMGDGIPVPGGTPIPTSGPNRNEDHTDDIEKALKYLSEEFNGGVLYFPCSGGPGGDLSIYNISSTISIPNNITIQSESSEEGIYSGRCRFYWNQFPNPGGCVNPLPTTAQAMFKVEGTKVRVRFKDIWMVSRILGRDCVDNGSWDKIRDQMTTGILLDAQTGGSISDVILENVSITGFTYGIKAVGNSVSDIKMRGVRPVTNHRQLYINATYAYDWDVQNFNLSGMLANQGAVEIINAGAPSNYPGENKKLKFLQLNCNGDFNRTSAFCVSIEKHGGLYFKGLHAEGSAKSVIVKDIGSAVNAEPIILEYSAAVAEINDDSAKLYLIGNFIGAAPDPVTAQQVNHPDKARLEFIGAGLQSTVIDCGDMHGDRTDTRLRDDPDNTPVGWDDWRMQFTHSERNRESFYAKDSNNNYFPKAHTVCPAGVSGKPDINEVGGEHFNTGVMPSDEDLTYTVTNKFSCASTPAACAAALQNLLDSTADSGTVQIVGPVTVDRAITIPSGKQLVGGKNTSGQVGELILSLPSNPPTPVDLLQINMRYYIPDECGQDPKDDTPCPPQPLRVSGITIRNLKLSTNYANTSGIAIVGLPFTDTTGVSSDMHFSGLTIENFGTGLDVRRFSPGMTNQMIDGLSWKNIKFVNNLTAASVVPSNVSNWNIINLNMESGSPGAVGWHHVNTGALMQNVACKGTSANKMDHCIKLEMAGMYLTGLKRTENVNNALTFWENWRMFNDQYTSAVFANTVLRNNDFTGDGTESGAVNFRGKTIITSMNNRYKNFKVLSGTADQGEFSRVTYCGDVFEVNNTPFPVLEPVHDNLYVGVKTPTLIQCGNGNGTPRPKPWEDVVNWGGETRPANESHYAADRPLVGNFNDNHLEDLVIYRENAQSEFRISSIDGKTKQTIPWGVPGDIPLTGNFIPGSRSQIVAWREVPNNNSQIWVYDPNTAIYYLWTFGLVGDKPFTGNFLDESSAVGGNMDEIAVYRPGNGQIWIANPRSGQSVNFTFSANNPVPIQVGDFLGLGFDQVAQYNNGVWDIVNPRTLHRYTANLGSAGDFPVPGRYLPGNCTQLGIWKENTEEIIIKDPEAVPVGTAPSVASCGNRPQKSIYWGSNNDGIATFETTGVFDCPAGNCPNDILLRINTPNSTLDRPTAYRPTYGVYPYSKAKGQWWIHDLIIP